MLMSDNLFKRFLVVQMTKMYLKMKTKLFNYKINQHKQIF